MERQEKRRSIYLSVPGVFFVLFCFIGGCFVLVLVCLFCFFFAYLVLFSFVTGGTAGMRRDMGQLGGVQNCGA